MTTQPATQRVQRKPGRGMRPWFLIPKVIAVATYFGAAAVTATLWWQWIGCQPDDALLANEALAWQLQTIRQLFVEIAIPALCVCLLLGAILFFQHPKAFINMRWMRVKLLLLAVGLPMGHLVMASRLYHFRTAAVEGVIHANLKQQLNWGFAILLMGSILLVWLGRHKPRLKQNWAKTFTSSVKPTLTLSLILLTACAPGSAPAPGNTPGNTTGDTSRRGGTSGGETSGGGLPGDFALELFVGGNAQTQRKYLLEPNRRLHLERGLEAKVDRYPLHYLTLTHEQYRQIVKLVLDYNIYAEPPHPQAKANCKTCRDVTITAWGKTHHFRTTKNGSPPTEKLLKLLMQLTEGNS